jgi:nicotinamide riboside kinase
MRVAILGAECTGKSTLSHALAAHLRANGTRWQCADEYLREWCQHHQRTPRRTEQTLIADAQAQRVDALTRQGLSVIADTTPLMTAVYSDVLFQDSLLYASALAHQRSYDLTLVTGMDLPWTPDGIQRDGESVRALVDRALRSVLQIHRIPHTVIYGTGNSRTLSALETIAHWQKKPSARSAHDTEHTWRCECCSDPQCEHQLFSHLLAKP